MDCAISWLVYNEGIKAIPGKIIMEYLIILCCLADSVSFRIAFLPILAQFEDTDKREQEIYDK